jgi:adenylate cyclase
LTYRIESYTTGGQILISEATLKEAGDAIIIDEEQQVHPKGIPQPIMIYSVGGIEGTHHLFLPKEEEVFYPLSEPISLEYRLLEGKAIGETLFKGRLLELSSKGALIFQIDGEENGRKLSRMSNLKLNFVDIELNHDIMDDIYAKVLEESREDSSFYIYFTAKSPSVSYFLDSLYDSLKLQASKAGSDFLRNS